MRVCWSLGEEPFGNETIVATGTYVDTNLRMPKE